MIFEKYVVLFQRFDGRKLELTTRDTTAIQRPTDKPIYKQNNNRFGQKPVLRYIPTLSKTNTWNFKKITYTLQ